MFSDGDLFHFGRDGCFESSPDLYFFLRVSTALLGLTLRSNQSVYICIYDPLNNSSRLSLDKTDHVNTKLDNVYQKMSTI